MMHERPQASNKKFSADQLDCVCDIPLRVHQLDHGFPIVALFANADTYGQSFALSCGTGNLQSVLNSRRG